MTATVQIEPPAECASVNNCPNEEDLTHTFSASEMVNGALSWSVVTMDYTQPWTVHVAITPEGFDCAMTITEACEEITPPPMDCLA